MNKRFLFILIIAAVVFSANSGGYPIYILDEAKNAACAMEMNSSDQWIVPTFNGELRTDKPPLHYFFMIMAFKVLGVSAFAARLFSVVMGVLTTALLYWFGSRLVNERSAFYAAIAFISSIQMAVQFHFAVPDPYLIAFSTWALLSFCYGYLHTKKTFLYIGYATAALAFLAKGPLAVIIIGLPLFILILIQKDWSWQTLLKIKLPVGLLLFLLIAVPWFIFVDLKTNGDWLQGFLFDHNLGRFTSTMEGHKGYPGVAILCFFIALLPTGVFLPQALLLSWKKREDHPALLLCLIVCAVVVGFFSVSKTFLPGYIAPCIPFASLIIGYYADHWLTKLSFSFSQKISAALIALISVALPIAAYFTLNSEFSYSSIPVYAAFSLLPLALGSVIMVGAFRSKRISAGLHFLLSGYLLSILAVFYLALPRLIDQNPVTRFITTHQVTSTDSLAIYKGTNPAFIFNLQRTIPVLKNKEDVHQFIRMHPSAKVLTRKGFLNELDTAAFKSVVAYRDLFETSVTVVLSN